MAQPTTTPTVIEPTTSPPGTEGEPTDLQADHLAAVLMAVGVASLLDLLTAAGRALAAGWSPSPLLPLVFFGIALLAFYRHRWTRLYRPFGGRMSIYVAEAIVLLLVTRLVPLLATPDRLLALLPLWWAEPWAVLDLGFIVDAALVGAAWFAGHSVGSAVDQLHVQPGELAPRRGTVDFGYWERSMAAFDHRAAQRRIAALTLSGGVIVIVGLTPFAMTRASIGLVIEGLIAAGLYLVAGLLLLGWAQVTLLDTLWRIDGLSVPAVLRRRWPGWLVLVLVLVGLLALIAPRSYAIDPLSLLVWLVAMAVGLVQLILFLIMLPFIWLASLLGLSSGGGSAAPPPALPPAVARTEVDWPWLAMVRSLGFWAITLGLAVYAVRTLYSSRWGVLRWLPSLSLLAALGRFWRSLLAGLQERVLTLATVLRPGSALRVAAGALRRPARPPRPTDPRGWIQFLYLSLIERAGRRGYPRRRGMTAAEYSRYLAARLAVNAEFRVSSSEFRVAGPEPSVAPVGVPGARTDSVMGPPGSEPATRNSELAELDVLTAAFLEARYSRHPVGEGEVGRARRALQRLLALIRSSRHHRAG